MNERVSVNSSAPPVEVELVDLGRLYAPAYLNEVVLGLIGLISSEVPPNRELVRDRDS